jgi:hypothetical protein
MALLQVRDFPDDLYAKLGELAKQERRSIAQQTVVIVRDTLRDRSIPDVDNRARRREALARLDELSKHVRPNHLDPVALIREDRDR